VGHDPARVQDASCTSFVPQCPENVDALLLCGLLAPPFPSREFPDAATKPDEIWLIQISPQRREREPRSISEILNRRGEMSGNLVLHQEIDFLNEINGLLEYLPEEHYTHVEVRKIEMLRELEAAWKMDRNPTFVDEMFAHGEEQAEEFLTRLS